MSNKTAILCPGPSLPKTWNHGRHFDYEHVIAVKRAILHTMCEWWVSGDWMCYTECDAEPLKGYCSTLEVTRGLENGSIVPKKKPFDPIVYVSWEDLPFHRGYSTIAAVGLSLYLAQTHGASLEVDIYGDDKSGDKDFDGHLGDNRNENRWAEEVAFMKDAIDFVSARGMTVRHIRE